MWVLLFLRRECTYWAVKEEKQPMYTWLQTLSITIKHLRVPIEWTLFAAADSLFTVHCFLACLTICIASTIDKSCSFAGNTEFLANICRVAARWTGNLIHSTWAVKSNITFRTAQWSFLTEQSTRTRVTWVTSRQWSHHPSWAWNLVLYNAVLTDDSW